MWVDKKLIHNFGSSTSLQRFVQENFDEDFIINIDVEDFFHPKSEFKKLYQKEIKIVKKGLNTKHLH
ncbi:hypothetical protein [Virgibacillus sp. DJP39]|uniref:hypothetical protein n=1 Tax=Virgibacillus sp. DJP39 TaxID=3409790 RepID=UPI003BB59D37